MTICNDAFCLQLHQKSTVICDVNLLHKLILLAFECLSECSRQIQSLVLNYITLQVLVPKVTVNRRECCDLCDMMLTSHVVTLFIQQLSALVCLTR